MKRLEILLLCAIAIRSSTSEDIKPEIPKNDDTKIINGNPATIGQFPWQAALFFQESPESRFWFCSGTIIGENWILTAAHCAHSAQSVLVYTGLIDISLDIKPTDIATEFIIHKDFVPDSFNHDIALIKLTQALTLDGNVATLPLSSDEVKVGTTVTVSGWGKTRSNDTSISALLNYVNLDTISTEQCQETYADLGLDFSNLICASSSSSPVGAPCHGDSGGPVVVDFGTKPRHVAIASFVSDEGCESGVPSGYTKTASYLDWIKEKTGI